MVSGSFLLKQMVLKIRKATKDDAPTLSRICLLTDNAGSSAEELHDSSELPGLVYAIPYLTLPTTWGFVLEDEEYNKIVGYIVGSTDTRAYERYAAAHWWPSIAVNYPPECATKAGDIQYAELLRRIPIAPDANISLSPAHLHINILPDYQKKGWGTRLIATAIEFLQNEGLPGVWLELDQENEGAKKFYERIGFKVIDGSENANEMWRKFEKPRTSIA